MEAESVLIIADSRFLRIHLSTLMENLGAEDVLHASNGYEALSLLDTEAPELITVDNILPDVMGVDLIKKIKAISPDSKIIMITQIDDEGVKAQAMEYAADAFLVKPVELDTLKECISAIENPA